MVFSFLILVIVVLLVKVDRNMKGVCRYLCR